MSPKELFDHLGHKIHKITCRGPCCGYERIPGKGEKRGLTIWSMLHKDSKDSESHDHKHDHDPKN